MAILNVEIKAKCNRPGQVHDLLKQHSARFIGIDHQIDTYFKVDTGRLKLREGNIENTLIYYQRPMQAGPKESLVNLYHTDAGDQLKAVLTQALKTHIVVDKQRSIYFIDNVKFHIDEVQSLGSFVEIEAIDEYGSIGRERLLEQCNFYLGLLGISKKDLIDRSYSDLLEEWHNR
jgi:predicted adenylyl cyclase CyaB